jgi:hypothetical protein
MSRHQIIPEEDGCPAHVVRRRCAWRDEPKVSRWPVGATPQTHEPLRGLGGGGVSRVARARARHVTAPPKKPKTHHPKPRDGLLPFRSRHSPLGGLGGAAGLGLVLAALRDVRAEGFLGGDVLLWEGWERRRRQTACFAGRRRCGVFTLGWGNEATYFYERAFCCVSLAHLVVVVQVADVALGGGGGQREGRGEHGEAEEGHGFGFF